MTLVKKIFIGYLVIYAITSYLCFNYYLPAVDIVQIVGTETKRLQAEVPSTEENQAHNNMVRDIYFISTRNASGKVEMYRNEDTGMGFPWYFKFNSADIQANALSINESKQHALIVYYGWRINTFSMFKNIIKIKSVDSFEASTFTFYSILKWFGWVIWLLLIIIQAIIPILFRRWYEARQDRKLGVE